MIILLAMAAFIAALCVDAFVLRPGFAPQSSPYALAPSPASLQYEGRAAYVDPSAQPAAPRGEASPSRSR
jgi:hypothetical protein